jgi:rhodanese-related sulfurtransferase
MNRIIIDVREPLEYKMGKVKGSINISPSKMMQGLPDALVDTPKDTEIILYCMSGARSATAMQVLRSYGFTNLVNGINKAQVQAKYIK